jgi:hypothetical protein
MWQWPDCNRSCDIKLVFADGRWLGLHSAVCKARLSGFDLLLDGSAIVAPSDVVMRGNVTFGATKREVCAAAKFSFEHVDWLIHYAYFDALPRRADTMAQIGGIDTEEQARAFLRDCVVPLAPEHERRITELLVSTRIRTPSRFEVDMRAAFRVSDNDDDDNDDDDDDNARSDVQLRLSDGRVVHAHRAVLSMASDWFHALVAGEWARNGPIDLTDCDATLVIAAIEFVYCGKCAWSEVDVVELLSLAQKLQLAELAARCEALLVDAIEPSQAAWLGQFATEHGLQSLKLAADGV